MGSVSTLTYYNAHATIFFADTVAVDMSVLHRQFLQTNNSKRYQLYSA